MNPKNHINSKADLVNFFHKAAVPKKDLLLGIEVERSAVFDSNLQPVTYYGANGYLAILKKLVREAGWKVLDEDAKGNIFALQRGDTYIYTEADGRLELATKPRKTLFSLNREFRMNEYELIEISKYFGVRWLSAGWHPFASNKQLPLIPKKRFELLRKYFADIKGSRGNLVKNNGIHINFGYTSEKCAIKQFQTIYKIAPIVSAMFANSPLNVGKYSGYMCKRLVSAQSLDFQRNGVRKEFFDNAFNFEKWVDIIIDLPIFYINRKVNDEKKYVSFDGKTTFREFMLHGYQGHYSRFSDFLLHLKSVWTQVRIKNYIEFRSVDTIPPSLVKSATALIKGVAFDDASLDAAYDLLRDLSFSEYCQLIDDVNKYALQAEVRGIKVLDYAKALLDIAGEGLKNINKQFKLKHDESRFLRPIKEYVFVLEQSPAEYIMEMWQGDWHKDHRRLLEWSEK